MTPQRAAILAEARLWIGTPFLHQASLRGLGCDCLGLVRGVWRACIGPEPESAPPYAFDWAERGAEETLADAAFRHFTPLDPERAEAGDILLFRWRPGAPAQHVAILTAPGRILHAHDGACVAEVALHESWRRRIVFAFAFPETGKRA